MNLPQKGAELISQLKDIELEVPFGVILMVAWVAREYPNARLLAGDVSIPSERWNWIILAMKFDPASQGRTGWDCR